MKEHRLFSTVIAGKYKHKKVFLPEKATTRSTKNIIRGAIFNSLLSDIYGSVFVELFAGSGSMGIEAISRGAKSAIFVEKDRDSFRCLKENLASLKIEDYHAINGDTFLVYDSVLCDIASSNGGAFLYFDPPFDTREGMENIYADTVSLIEKTPAKNIHKIYIEHISSFIPPENIASFYKCKIRKFGKTTISEYEPS